MYAAGAWTHRSGYLQDVMYAAGAWTHRSGYLQDVMYVMNRAMIAPGNQIAFPTFMWVRCSNGANGQEVRL